MSYSDKPDFEYIKQLSLCMDELRGKVFHPDYMRDDPMMQKNMTYDEVIRSIDTMHDTISDKLKTERGEKVHAVHVDFDNKMDENDVQAAFAKKLAQVLLLEEGKCHDFAVQFVASTLADYAEKMPLREVLEKRIKEERGKRPHLWRETAAPPSTCASDPDHPAEQCAGIAVD